MDLGKNKTFIGILGCGWLGAELAKALISAGYKVFGSTTSPNKIPILKNLGIDPYLVHFESGIQPDINFLQQADIVVLALPPGRNPTANAAYRQMANILAEKLPHSKIKKLILLSSVSVYGDRNAIFSETDPAQPDTNSGELLAETEAQLLQSDPRVIVLRLGGLIGPGRHPGRFFAGKTDIPNGLAPVNLIHQADAVGIILKLIETEQASGIYNGCAPDHPSRVDFYTLASEAIGLETPTFIAEKKAWKIIESHRLKEELRYQFQVGDLIEYLKNRK
ncbi:MAG TPA: SDR family oxidoreductase [Daejeonella sp.]|nr:SDR family oxidoreductase [Daejeonella sp.]